ncbi:MAG: hypothetical protein HFJ75_07675 [Eggerthellaceae bacterium]|nr:hypothetical protein [Eggerthellaceae bacterium]
MTTAEDRVFPDGLPEAMSFAAFSKLLGVSRPQGAKIARSRPDMLIWYPTEKTPRVRTDLYLEIVGKQKR